MSDAKRAWDEVGARLSDLARHLKESYEARTAGGDATPERVEDALRTLVDALDQAVRAVGDTWRDARAREEITQTAATLGEAVATSLTEVGERIRARLG